MKCNRNVKELDRVEEYNRKEIRERIEGMMSKIM